MSTASKADPVGIVLSVARSGFAETLRAYEDALQREDPQEIFLRGSELLTRIYSISHSQLNASRASAEAAVTVGYQILNVAYKLRDELEIVPPANRL